MPSYLFLCEHFVFDLHWKQIEPRIPVLWYFCKLCLWFRLNSGRTLVSSYLFLCANFVFDYNWRRTEPSIPVLWSFCKLCLWFRLSTNRTLKSSYLYLYANLVFEFKSFDHCFSLITISISCQRRSNVSLALLQRLKNMHLIIKALIYRHVSQYVVTS